METKNTDDIKVDFRLRDTELGWQQRLDKYALILVPAWFNVLGWVGLLAGIEFLHAKSKSFALGLLVVLSLVFIWLYFNAVFYRVWFVGVAPKRSVKTQIRISIIISSLLSWGIYWLSRYIVELIAQVTGP
jgi:hypothetical protein